VAVAVRLLLQVVVEQADTEHRQRLLLPLILHIQLRLEQVAQED
jgi:hypothetical protein